jgi:hypothetical protein
MVFIGLWPRSVKSPLVILGHHVVASLFLLVPYHYPQHQRMLGYCMLVEVSALAPASSRPSASPGCLPHAPRRRRRRAQVNTLLLIARRNCRSGALRAAVDALFYASWVLLRCAWYPYLAHSFYLSWRQESARVGGACHGACPPPCPPSPQRARLPRRQLRGTWLLALAGAALSSVITD